MTYINTRTHPEHDPPRCLVKEYDLLYRRHPQKQGDTILTPQQIYNRLKHCQRTTKALLRALEPYDNLSKTLCGLIVELIGEEICCINLARHYRNNMDTSRRVRELENLLESYDDLLCHQSRHNGERVIEDAPKTARRWRNRPPLMRDDFSSSSSGNSIIDCSLDEQEHPIGTKALTKSQLVDYLQELVKAENEEWRDMEDMQRSQPAQSEWHTADSSQLDNSHLRKHGDIRPSSLLLQAERAASLAALDHNSRNPSISSTASTRKASPEPEAKCIRVGGSKRRTSSLPDPADMSNRHAMLRWLKKSASQQQEQQQHQHQHPNEELNPTREKPAHQHQEHKPMTTPPPPPPTMTTTNPEEQQERRKQELDEAVKKLRKLGHGEIRIPEPTREDRGRSGRSERAGDNDDDDDDGEDNAVLRELKMARRQRWDFADGGGGGGGMTSDSDSGS
ncbi:hypothetical protein F5X96DRAFT_198243 [Biscogniauxia mediterranea]|nr:hypothetical protein F5X96DRAFT_198243 [Biscogniauxia mediterranea]